MQLNNTAAAGDVPAAGRLLRFAFGESRRTHEVRNVELSWNDFIAEFDESAVIRTGETMDEYMRLPNEAQSDLKDVGHYTPGAYRNGVRRKENISFRGVITMDVDHAPDDFLARLLHKVTGLGIYEFVVHTTRKDRAGARKYRVLFAARRDMNALEYGAVSRAMADCLPTGSDLRSIEWFDETGFEFTRVNFWSSASIDQKYEVIHNEGDWVDPDEWLALYDDHTDMDSWPVSAKMAGKLHADRRKAGNTCEKPGIIGAFCRTYDPHQVIDKYLSDHFLPGASSNRYTYAHSSGANGAVVYADGHLYSRHESDPGYLLNLNSFDLVRVHLFRHLDTAVGPDTPIHRTPSHVATERLAIEDPDVAAELHQAGIDKAAEDFEGFDADVPGASSVGRIEAPHDSETAPTVITLMDFHCYLPEAGQYIFHPTGALWPAKSVDARLPPVPRGRAVNMSEIASTALKEQPKEGERKKRRKRTPDDCDAPSAWLSLHRRVEQMTWHPAEPRVIADRLLVDGGWIRRPGVQAFNLYRPPILLAGHAGEATPWLDHVRRIYPDEAEHLILWLAHRVQRPGEKINHAIVLGGSQGIGKDSILAPVIQSVGPWNFSEVSPTQLIGRFNSFIKSVILRISEARDLGDSDRFKFYEHMKTYTAAPPEVMMCDEKFRQAYPVVNVCGAVLTTNHKTDGIFLPPDDRRHFVAWSEAIKEEFPADYWPNLYAWYTTGGGYGHVAAYLRGVNLNGFDAKAPPPKTAAFWAIVDASRASEDSELSDTIDALGAPDALTLQDLVRKASSELRMYLTDRKHRRTIAHRLDSVGYTSIRDGVTKDGLYVVDGKRQTIYAKKALSINARLEAARTRAGQRVGDSFDGVD